MSIDLPIEPLCRAAFAPFGDVIETPGAEQFFINEGTTTRFHDLADVDIAQHAGRPLISIFRASPRPRRIRIRMMERHPIGSQAFIPLLAAEWLVVVCDGASAPDPETLRCFRAQGDQGVNYRAGVWHHPLLALQAQDFLVLDRGGDPDETVENLEEVWFDRADHHRMITW